MSGKVSGRDDFIRAFNVSRETIERLDIYHALLQRWQARINLIAPSTIDTIWHRHIADSFQLLSLAEDARQWTDIGSGAGFPGMVIAIELASRQPERSVHLIESNGKKSSFLREVARETGARAVIHQGRVEDVLPRLSETQAIDVITARALASLTQLLTYTDELLTSGARALFLKGQDVEHELTQAAKYWNLSYRLHRSATSDDGSIVEIAGLSRLGGVPKS